MRRVVLFLLFSLLFLTSCKKENIDNVNGDEYIFGSDFQKNFHNGNFGGFIACENDKGFFFLKNSFLYYIEKSSMETTIVCSKLECKHDNYDCNAFVPSEQLAYNDNKLYYLTSGQYNDIYSMELDGSNRKQIVTYTNELSSTYIIHRGNIYFVENLCLYSISLNDKNKKEKVYEFSNVNEIYFILWADGDNVYVCTENQNYVQEFYAYDLLDNKFERIWSIDSINEDWVSKDVGLNGWYINKSAIYYYLCGNGIWMYNFSDGKYTKIVGITDKSQYGYATFDDNYIYINTSISILNSQDASEYTIYVYDYQGMLVDKIPIGSIYTNKGFIDFSLVASTSDKVFCIGTASELIDYYFNDKQFQFNDTNIFCLPIPNQEKGLIEVELGAKVLP